MTGITSRRILLSGARLAVVVLWVSTSSCSYQQDHSSGRSKSMYYAKKVTSLAEVKSLTNKLFAVFDDLIARNSGTVQDRSVIYSGSRSGYVDIEHLPYTIGAIVKYFENELLISHPDKVIELHKEFHAWRESALQLTDKALEKREKKAASINRDSPFNMYPVDALEEKLVEIRTKLDDYKQSSKN